MHFLYCPTAGNNHNNMSAGGWSRCCSFSVTQALPNLLLKFSRLYMALELKLPIQSSFKILAFWTHFDLMEDFFSKIWLLFLIKDIIFEGGRQGRISDCVAAIPDFIPQRWIKSSIILCTICPFDHLSDACACSKHIIPRMGPPHVIHLITDQVKVYMST